MEQYEPDSRVLKSLFLGTDEEIVQLIHGRLDPEEVLDLLERIEANAELEARFDFLVGEHEAQSSLIDAAPVEISGGADLSNSLLGFTLDVKVEADRKERVIGLRFDDPASRGDVYRLAAKASQLGERLNHFLSELLGPGRSASSFGLQQFAFAASVASALPLAPFPQNGRWIPVVQCDGVDFEEYDIAIEGGRAVRITLGDAAASTSRRLTVTWATMEAGSIIGGGEATLEANQGKYSLTIPGWLPGRSYKVFLAWV